jgi:hypothetical protein
MTPSDRIREWLSNNPDDIVLRALFGAMLLGTAGVLGLDFAEMQAALPAAETHAPAGPVASPSGEPLPPSRRGADRKHPARAPDKALCGAHDLRTSGRRETDGDRYDRAGHGGILLG